MLYRYFCSGLHLKTVSPTCFIYVWLTLYHVIPMFQDPESTTALKSKHIVRKGDHVGNRHIFLSPKRFLPINPLPDMLILGSSSSAVNKDMMATIWTKEDTIICSSRKHCGKRRNCSL